VEKVDLLDSDAEPHLSELRVDLLHPGESCGIVLLSGHGCWSEQRDQDNKNEAESAVDHDE
jgi:hypothetical protein